MTLTTLMLSLNLVEESYETTDDEINQAHSYLVLLALVAAAAFTRRSVVASSRGKRRTQRRSDGWAITGPTGGMCALSRLIERSARFELWQLDGQISRP